MNEREKNYVVLVNKEDKVIGLMEKMEAHQKGMLHRAVSVIVFNSDGKMLLQQRAKSKYHSGELWSNACCTHPFLNEDVRDAAIRRLKEEMGIFPPKIFFLDKFLYYADLNNGLKEHELDHLFIAVCDDIPIVNPQEVMNFQYMALDDLKKDVEKKPQKYTYWFRLIVERLSSVNIQKYFNYVD